jgi:hypothetical protein
MMRNQHNAEMSKQKINAERFLLIAFFSDVPGEPNMFSKIFLKSEMI